MGRVFVRGDSHGNFTFLPRFCEDFQTTKEDTLIILGDAGINYYLGSSDRKLKKFISHFPITLFCIHGNHEERPQNIDTYKAAYYKKYGCYCWYEEEYPNILFPFNGPATINGKDCLIIGGAYSVDKYYRLEHGYTWFESEQLTDFEKEELLNRLEEKSSFDYILTHTAPLKYEPTYLFLNCIDQTTVDKSMEIFLQKVYDKIDFKQWFLGHYHSDVSLTSKIHLLYKGIIELK